MTKAKKKPFGGMTVVLGGDFRQILPVVPKGRREHIVNASIKRSYLWNHFEVYNLAKIMELRCISNDKNNRRSRILLSED